MFLNTYKHSSPRMMSETSTSNFLSALMMLKMALESKLAECSRYFSLGLRIPGAAASTSTPLNRSWYIWMIKTLRSSKLFREYLERQLASKQGTSAKLPGRWKLRVLIPPYANLSSITPVKPTSMPSDRVMKILLKYIQIIF